MFYKNFEAILEKIKRIQENLKNFREILKKIEKF